MEGPLIRRHRARNRAPVAGIESSVSSVSSVVQSRAGPRRVPREGGPPRLLFVVDVLSPGATLPPLGSAEVEAFLTARGLDAERIVGGYGGIATRADLQAAANQR